MKVLVLGAGVIGVTTAYYLARRGHEVTVVDRQAGPALETSFANAGQISPGYAAPWAAPGIPLKAIGWLFARDSPLIVRPAFDLGMYLWLVRMLFNCRSSRYAVNKARMVRIAEYSRACLDSLRAETGIEYDQRSLGTLQLFRSEAGLAGAAKDVAVLDRLGVPYELLDRKACVAAEPALERTDVHIAGGLRMPNDQTGDCYAFTSQLASLAAALGVSFRYDERIEAIATDGDRVSCVRTDRGTVNADHYVAALGSFAPGLLRPIGLHLPVYPVKGYSITVPVAEPDGAPRSTILDDAHKVAITRLGNRIRIGGMAEISGFGMQLLEKRRRTLAKVLGDLFPRCGDDGRASFWTGLRPMTPDGTPILGPTSLANLSLNTGHGTLGWTMACGSASVLADQLSGRRPDIDTSDLSLARY